MKVNTYRPAGRKTWSFHLHARQIPTPSHQIRRGGFRTEQEAQREGRKIARTIDDGTFVARTAETAGGFLTTWLRTKAPSVKPSTAASYATVVEAHIGPRLGGVKLDTFARKAEVVATFQADLLTSGRRDGRGGLSAKTVRNIMGVLHKAMDDAVKWGRIARNPLDAVDLPPWERPEMRVWSAPQQRVFVDGTADTRLGAAWRLLLLTGCRRGELAGLRWRDVDLSAGAVTFVTTRVKAGTRTVEATPKTPGSVRRVALDAGTLNALRRWQRAQSAERLAAGAGWCTRGERSDDYVVADEVGRPYAPQTLTRWFNRESARLELPAIRLHDGRHSHATTALNDARQPVKVVSQRLGHSDVATTMRLYQHVLPRDDQRAADETAAAIFGQAVTPGVT